MKYDDIFMKRCPVANLQVKGIDDVFYEDLKRLAASESRSVSQQVVVILRDYVAKKERLGKIKTPAEVLLELAGSWEDERGAEEIVLSIRSARRSSTKLKEGL